VPVDVVTLPSARDQFVELLAWLDAVHPGQVDVLDVGGGGEFYDFPSQIRARARRLVGVDPDPRVMNRPWFDDAYPGLVEDYARNAAERFDIALCVYVAEHVETPGPFLEAIRSVLRPGGSCFGVTPNLWHYFGLTSAIAARLGLEDWLLPKVRTDELIEAYHSPVRYRLNTIHRLDATARDAGFERIEVRTLEQSGMFETYFPPHLRWWPRGYSRVVNRLGRGALFGTLLFRLVA
jgi:SAM-dependent methyltransferase